MANRNQRGKNNNNPHGHNQYTNDFLAPAKDHPFATAAAAAAAVGAGLFLWSKRDRVGNQVSRISQTANEMAHKASSKAGDWLDQMQDKGREMMASDEPTTASRRTPSRSTRKPKARTSANRAGAEPVSY